MRAHLLTTFLFVVTSLTLYSQTSVTLNIHHKLGTENFVMGTEVTNNIGSNFDFTRLEYYLAEISLIHDGGQETAIEDLYILVDAEEEVSQELGDVVVTNVEAIRFHVGVDESNNHTDPTTYHSSHALSPQFPSMHWGWASGYRFGAFEGNSGTNMGQIWQLHALGDANYFQTEVQLDLVAVNNELIINLDADYIRSMENIELNSGPIVHGGYDEAIVSLRNFQDYVFTPSEVVSNNEELLKINAFKLYPNPATAKQNSVFIATATEEVYQLRITNSQGQLVKQFDQVTSNTEINLGLEIAGLYFISLQKNGSTLKTEKLVIQ